MKVNSKNMCIILLGLLLLVCFISSSQLGLEGFSDDEHNTEPHVRSSTNTPAQITPGFEDLYVLKSEVVPPVCPSTTIVKDSEAIAAEKCPPCPPCGRCPEPSFECKKVPNYSAGANDALPRPVLNDFSQFGM